MKMLYDIITSNSWMSEAEFLSICNSSTVNASARMLLISDGSLTRLLNAYFLSPVSLQRLRQEELNLDFEMAGYIEAEAGQKVIDRDVWLMKGDERVVYANSILPTSLMKGEIYNGITRGDIPLGTLLLEQSMLIRRDKLQIARVKSPELSRDIGCPEDVILWARRYRLNAEGGFRGAITEVFSPSLFE